MQRIVSVIVRPMHVVRPKAASVVLSRVVVSSKFSGQRERFSCRISSGAASLGFGD